MNDKLLLNNRWINFAKCIATILIVMVHAGNILSYANVGEGDLIYTILSPFRTIASFGVPIFFIISGYLLFLKEFDWKQNLKKKVRTLLVPFLFWNIAWMMFEFLGGFILPGMFENFSKWSWLDWIMKFSFDSFYIPFWFIWYLFVMNVLSGVMRWLFQKSQLVSVIVVLIVLLLPFYSLHASRWKQAVAFFMVGGLIAIHREKISDCFEKIKHHLVLVGVLITTGIIALTSVFAGNEFVRHGALLIGSMALLATFIGMSEGVDNAKYTRWVPHTFIIYAVHGKIISIFQILAIKLLGQSNVVITAEYFLLPAIVILLCVVFSVIFQKLAPGLFRFSQGGR